MSCIWIGMGGTRHAELRLNFCIINSIVRDHFRRQNDRYIRTQLIFKRSSIFDYVDIVSTRIGKNLIKTRIAKRMYVYVPTLPYLWIGKLKS